MCIRDRYCIEYYFCVERSHAAEGTQIESDIVILYTQFSIIYYVCHLLLLIFKHEKSTYLIDAKSLKFILLSIAFIILPFMVKGHCLVHTPVAMFVCRLPT